MTTEQENIEMVDGEPVEEVSSVSMTLDRTEVDMQVTTAHRFPRNIKTFKSDALSMATIDQETAESCFYVLPRSNKNIEGPSVRLAEIVASCWGNMRIGTRVVHEDDKFITAQGMAFDLQRNVAITIEVRRRITDKYEKKFNSDMIGVTGNAASSIALRNAVFRVVPMAYVNSIYQAAKRVAIGDAKSLSTRRDQIIDRFAKMGVQKDRILPALEREFPERKFKGVEDIDLEALEKLIGMGTAIKDGQLAIDTAFPQLHPVADAEPAKNKTDALAQKMGVGAKARQPGEDG